MAKKATAQNVRVSNPDRAHADKLLELVTTSLDDDKALDAVVIDLAEKSNLADYLVIASGSSARQVSAMADHLAEKMKALGLKGVSVEGADKADWVLIDGGDVIVHLFRPEVREFYNLEKMWAMPAQAAQEGATL